MPFVFACHIILTPTQPVGSWRIEPSTSSPGVARSTERATEEGGGGGGGLSFQTLSILAHFVDILNLEIQKSIVTH